jgi:hypothetical protein
MVERVEFGRPVTQSFAHIVKECVVCKSCSDLVFIEISNGYHTVFAGYFCNWVEYSVWKKDFDVNRKKLLEVYTITD